MDWYLMALKRFGDFQGRSRRKEYWMFALFNLIAMVVLRVAGGGGDGGTGEVLEGIYGLVILVPSIAVGIRRFHDIGKSGWWMLLTLIPLLGGLAVLYFTLQDSQPDSNQYGPNPKAVSA